LSKMMPITTPWESLPTRVRRLRAQFHYKKVVTERSRSQDEHCSPSAEAVDCGYGMPEDRLPAGEAKVRGLGNPDYAPDKILKSKHKHLSVPKLIRKSISRIVSVFRAYGFEDKGYNIDRSVRCAMTIFHSYRNSMSAMGWIKTLKYMIISYWRFHSGLDHVYDSKFASPIQLPGLILYGRAARFQLQLKKKDPDMFDSLVNTILIGLKGGLPRPDSQALEESVEDFRNDVFRGAPHVRDPEICEKLRYYITRLLEGKKCEVQEVARVPRVPSTSSNYVNGRKGGGCVGTFLTDEYFLAHVKPLASGLVVQPSIVYDQNEGRKVISDKFYYDPTPIEDNFQSFYLYCRNFCRSEDPIVTPVSLSEALKVRMITKCPPYLMFVMNSFIDPLRKLLRNFPVFELTGRPIDEHVIDKVFKHADRPINSGDYVASTDSIHSWVSEEIADILCDTFYSNFGNDFRDLLRRSLTGFKTFEFTDGLLDTRLPLGNGCFTGWNRTGTWIPKSFEPLNQVRGQLMGSVTSFPVLCLANYTLCKMAMEYNPNDWDEALLINGDDCVFEACPRAYEQWKVFGEVFGLSPSPGKVDYGIGRLQMNSRVFRWKYDRLDSYRTSHFDYDFSTNLWSERPRNWYFVPIMMMGIASAQKRSESAESYDFEGMDYDSSKKEFLWNLRGFSPAYLEMATREFDKLYIPAVLERYHSLKTEFKRSDDPNKRRNVAYLNFIPFNLPSKYGGLGLPGRPSDMDYATAHYMYENGITCGPQGGKTWLFHDLLRSDLARICEPAALGENEVCDLGHLYWSSFVNHRDGVFVDECNVLLESNRWINRGRRFNNCRSWALREKRRYPKTLPPDNNVSYGWRLLSCKSSMTDFTFLSHVID